MAKKTPSNDKKKPGNNRGEGRNPNRGRGDPAAPTLSPEEIKRQANEKALGDLYGAEGVNAGNALINKFLQPGALGRVDTNLPGATESLGRYQQLNDRYNARDPMQTDVLNRMQGGLDGYTSQENQAQREQMMKGLQSNYATSSSQLARAQARGKVFGAAGAAQQANLARDSEASKNDLEQQLMIKNIDEKRSRLNEYGQYGQTLTNDEFTRQSQNTKAYGDEASRLRDEELGRQKINIGQANAETAGQIGAFTGAGATALAQQNTDAAQDIQRQGIRAINGGSVDSGTKKKARERAARRM